MCTCKKVCVRKHVQTTHTFVQSFDFVVVGFVFSAVQYNSKELVLALELVEKDLTENCNEKCWEK